MARSGVHLQRTDHHSLSGERAMAIWLNGASAVYAQSASAQRIVRCLYSARPMTQRFCDVQRPDLSALL